MQASVQGDPRQLGFGNENIRKKEVIQAREDKRQRHTKRFRETALSGLAERESVRM